MACSPVKSLNTSSDTSLDDLLGVTEPDVPTLLLADDRSGKEVDFDVTDMMAVFNKKNDKVHMCIGVTSVMLQLSINVFDKGPVQPYSAHYSSH